MKKLFGNGRPIAATILAVGLAAIAVPAFGASSGSGGSGGSASSNAVPSGAPLPPFPGPPTLSGAARKNLEQTAQCMKSHGVDSPPSDVSRKALEQAAKDCGAPPPPPRDAMLPPPMAAPGERAKLSGAVTRCLQAQARR
jgi:hypothetical protein